MVSWAYRMEYFRWVRTWNKYVKKHIYMVSMWKKKCLKVGWRQAVLFQLWHLSHILPNVLRALYRWVLSTSYLGDIAFAKSPFSCIQHWRHFIGEKNLYHSSEFSQMLSWSRGRDMQNMSFLHSFKKFIRFIFVHYIFLVHCIYSILFFLSLHNGKGCRVFFF